jgi:hypothetical protein
MNPPPLADTQREFFGALLNPLRGSSRRSTDLTPCDAPHDPAFLATADRLLRHSPTLLPAECLELYHRQYWFRILDSLEEDFPYLIRLIGKQAFWEVAEQYLLEKPSQSYTLRHLGSRLPAYLEQHLADPVTRRRAVAVAEIEYSLMASFEAPDAIPIPPERIAGGTRFTLHPAVILLEQTANASAWLDDEDLAWLDDGETRFHTAVWRTSEHRLRHENLTHGAYRMLCRIRDQPMSLNEWLNQCADDVPNPATLTEWFSQWRDREWFAEPSVKFTHLEVL